MLVPIINSIIETYKPISTRLLQVMSITMNFFHIWSDSIGHGKVNIEVEKSERKT